MSSLQFENYFLNELSYKKNLDFDSSVETIDLYPEIYAHIIINKGANHAFVNLNTRQGNLEHSDSAFELTVDIVGEFSFEYDDTEYDIEFETFLKENALAILWSYIRPMVSDLITRANEFPNFILPVINVKKLLEEKNSIQIEYK